MSRSATCASITTDMHRSGISELAVRYLTGHAANDIMNAYISLDPGHEMAKYFEYIDALLVRLHNRALKLGIATASPE